MNVLQDIDSMRWPFSLLFLFIVFLTACETGEKQMSDINLRDAEEISLSSGAENRQESEDRSGGNEMTGYDFSIFSNVELIGVDLSDMSDEQLEVLYQQVRYCQAMTEADTNILREIVSEDKMFTHMSGRQQTREEYFADIEDGSLRYFTIGIDTPVVETKGDIASITFISVLDASAYGAKGVYRMSGTHWFEKRDGNGVLSIRRIVKGFMICHIFAKSVA